MSFRRLQRKTRCFFKYGRSCPHIERHSRRRPLPATRRVDEAAGPPLLRQALPVVPPTPQGRHVQPDSIIV